MDDVSSLTMSDVKNLLSHYLLHAQEVMKGMHEDETKKEFVFKQWASMISIMVSPYCEDLRIFERLFYGPGLRPYIWEMFDEFYQKHPNEADYARSLLLLLMTRNRVPESWKHITDFHINHLDLRMCSKSVPCTIYGLLIWYIQNVPSDSIIIYILSKIQDVKEPDTWDCAIDAATLKKRHSLVSILRSKKLLPFRDKLALSIDELEAELSIDPDKPWNNSDFWIEKVIRLGADKRLKRDVCYNCHYNVIHCLRTIKEEPPKTAPEGRVFFVFFK